MVEVREAGLPKLDSLHSSTALPSSDIFAEQPRIQSKHQAQIRPVQDVAIGTSKTLLKYLTVVTKPIIATVKAVFYTSANSWSREGETGNQQGKRSYYSKRHD
jgi:hypothetical protein